MVWSENFHFKPFLDSRAKRERERSNPKPRALRLRTLRLRCLTSTSNHTQIAPFNFVGKPRAQITPSTLPRSHPKIASRQHRSLWSHWDCNWEMVGFWWIWPDLMNFFCWVLFLCLSIEKWYYIFIWKLRKCEKNVRNKKKMCFLYYFQQHNQTLENIFQRIFWNATKHLKIFFFPENSITGKYFTWPKHSLSNN